VDTLDRAVTEKMEARAKRFNIKSGGSDVKYDDYVKLYSRYRLYFNSPFTLAIWRCVFWAQCYKTFYGRNLQMGPNKLECFSLAILYRVVFGNTLVV